MATSAGGGGAGASRETARRRRRSGIWSAARLLGVELTVGKGADPGRVGPVDMLVATVLAGLLAWATHSLLARPLRTPTQLDRHLGTRHDLTDTSGTVTPDILG